MTCLEYDRLADSERPGDQRTLEEHARSCAQCRTRIAWEERLAQAVRSLRPEPLEELLPEILRRRRAEREAVPKPARVLRPRWRPFVPVAAALAVAVTLWLAGIFRDGAAGNPHLLTEQAHRNVQQDEVVLARQGATLMARFQTPAADERARALLEEARCLDLAVAECRRALDANPRSRHLNDRLLELSRRRNRLLESAGRESQG